MSKWISNTVNISGEESEIARFMRDAEGFDNPSTADSDNQSWSVFSFSKLYPPPMSILQGDRADMTEWQCDHWGSKWEADDPKVVSRTPTSVTYHFGTPWSPPLGLLQKVSADFQDLTFELSCSEELTLADAYSFKGGQIEWVRHQNGYFTHRAELEGPVHHRWIWIRLEGGENRDVISCRLTEAGFLIEGEEAAARAVSSVFCFTSRHNATTTRAFLCEQFPGFANEVWEMAFTLDEAKYLGSIHTLVQNRTCNLDTYPYGQSAYPHSPVRIPEDLRPLYAICERPIVLTREEADSAIRGLLACPDKYPGELPLDRLERLRLYVGPETFRQSYGNLIWETATRWHRFSVTGEGGPVVPSVETLRRSICPLFRRSYAVWGAALLWWFERPLPEGQSVEWGYGGYAPTRQELEIVLEGHRRDPLPTSPARMAQIETAIWSPRWATAWPLWERPNSAKVA